jgi:hypothetical protein
MDRAAWHTSVLRIWLSAVNSAISLVATDCVRFLAAEPVQCVRCCETQFEFRPRGLAVQASDMARLLAAGLAGLAAAVVSAGESSTVTGVSCVVGCKRVLHAQAR